MEKLYGHYPLLMGAPRSQVHAVIERQDTILMDQIPFRELTVPERREIYESIVTFDQEVEALYLAEQRDRLKVPPAPYATLFYHNIDHSDQTTYDLLALLNQIFTSNTVMARHLSREVIISLRKTARGHDIGYLTAPIFPENFAARKDVHVVESAKKIEQLMAASKLPPVLNRELMIQIAHIGTFATNYPWQGQYEEKINQMIGQLSGSNKLSGEIARGLMHCADLGGQSARTDQVHHGLELLEKELNWYQAGFGTKTVGSNPLQRATKLQGFIMTEVYRRLNPWAVWLLGIEVNEDYPLSMEWRMQRPERLGCPPTTHFCEDLAA